MQFISITALNYIINNFHRRYIPQCIHMYIYQHISSTYIIVSGLCYCVYGMYNSIQFSSVHDKSTTYTYMHRLPTR